MSTDDPDDIPTGSPVERRLVVVNGGTSDPSSSRMLADRIAQKAIAHLATQGITATARAIDLGPLAGDIAHAIVSGTPEGRLADAVRILADADGVIATTPVYKGGVSGLFKSFIDILDNDLLIATPVALAASAGSERHALVIDDQLRPLFAFLRTLTVPTSVFAAPQDWADPALGKRIERAAIELAALVGSGVATTITRDGWDRYQHTWGGSARDGEDAFAVDFDTDLMRLATGGR